jgi:hypothetical protein
LFSSLFTTASWTPGNVTGQILITVIPDASGTYTAAVVQIQPFLLASYSKGSVSGQTLTFNSGVTGLYGEQHVTSGTLTLTVGGFNQVGSAVTGNLTVNGTSGAITGESTYLP